MFKLQVDLVSFIAKSSCECLNDSDDHPFANSLTAGGGYLESDCDEQVLYLSYNYIIYMIMNVSVECIMK